MKAVIVIDAQIDFVTGALRNEEAIKSLPTLHAVVDWAVNNDYDLIYTKDTHDANYLNTQEGKNLPVPHCFWNTEGWEIVSEALPDHYYDKCVFIMKTQFGYTNWREERLKKYDEIIVIGYVSSICVVTNALIIKSLYPEIPITFITDASAGLTPQNHQAAIEVLKSCQINCVTWEEYLKENN